MLTTIEIPTVDGPMPAFSALPDSTARGAIIVIQEAFGLTDHIGQVARRFADAGFRAIAPALFHRAGGSPTAAYDDIPSVYPLMAALAPEPLSIDLEATIATLATEGFADSQIGMVGFCMGGLVTLFAATRPGIGAAVTYYGGGLTTSRFGLPTGIELGSSIRCPWIGHFGDLDQGIPVEEVEQLRAAAAGAGPTTEVFRYVDADHGFNCNDRPAVYNAQAASLAWERTIEHFGSTLHR